MAENPLFTPTIRCSLRFILGDNFMISLPLFRVWNWKSYSETVMQPCVFETWPIIVCYHLQPFLTFSGSSWCFEPCSVLWHYVRCFVLLFLFSSLSHCPLISEIVLDFHFVAENVLLHISYDFIFDSCIYCQHMNV